jgi:hypothetical protein
MDANRNSESGDDNDGNDDEESSDGEESGAELSKLIIAQLDNTRAAHNTVTKDNRESNKDAAHVRVEQVQNEVDSSEDEDIGFDWDEIPGCPTKEENASNAGMLASSESDTTAQVNSNTSQPSAEPVLKRSPKKGLGKLPPKLDEYGLRVRDKMTLNRKGIEIISPAWKKWQKERRDRTDGKVIKSKTAEETEQGFTIGEAEPLPEPNSYAYESDEPIAADDPYHAKGCQRRMVFASDVVPEQIQYSRSGEYTDGSADNDYKTALDKFSNWALTRPHSTSKDVAGHRDSKTPRHFVLQMGPPNGKYGQPSELAGRFNNVANLYFRKRLSKSHLTIETDISYHNLASKGYYKEYISTLIGLMEPKTKLGQRLTIKLSERTCAQWMVASPTAFYPHPTDITAEWTKIMNNTHDETFSHTILVQYGRTGFDSKKNSRMPDAKDIKVAEEQHYKQQLRKMEHEKAQINSALKDIQDFIVAVEHHERMKDSDYAAKVHEEAAAAKLQKEIADAEEAARFAEWEKALKEKMDAKYGPRKTPASKSQGNTAKVSRPKSFTPSASQENNQPAGYKSLQPPSIQSKQAQPLLYPPIPTIPQDITVYTAEGHADPPVDPRLFDGDDQRSHQNGNLGSTYPSPAHQVDPVGTGVRASEPLSPAVRSSEGPLQTERHSLATGSPVLWRPMIPQEQFQSGPYSYSPLSSPWQEPERSTPVSAVHASSTQQQAIQATRPPSYPRQRQSRPAQRILAPRPPQQAHQLPAVAPSSSLPQPHPYPQLPAAPAGFSPFSNAFPTPPQRPIPHTQAELDWFVKYKAEQEAKARRKLEIAKGKKQREEKRRQDEMGSGDNKRARGTSSGSDQQTAPQPTLSRPQASQPSTVTGGSSFPAQYSHHGMTGPVQAHQQGPAPIRSLPRQPTEDGHQYNLVANGSQHMPQTPRQSVSPDSMGAIPGSSPTAPSNVEQTSTQPAGNSQGKRKRDGDAEDGSAGKRGKK